MWRYTRSGIQTEVSLFESMPRKNLDTVRGALVGPTGNVLRSSFAIPAALPTTQAKSHNFQPAVASDGVNFLVVSELADETNYDTYLDIRLFDAAGNLIGQPSAQLLSTDRLAIGPTEQGVALDVAWIGDRYRVAYKFMSKNNEPRTIALRDFDAAGNPLGTGWTTATTQAVPTASRPRTAPATKTEPSVRTGRVKWGRAVRVTATTNTSTRAGNPDDVRSQFHPSIVGHAPVAQR